MGTGAETARATAAGAAGNAAKRSACCRSGCFVRSTPKHCWRCCHATVRSIAVLEQTKEPGAPGEPLYLASWSTATLARSAALASAVQRGPHHAARRRRPLRPVVEGFLARAGQGGVRRTTQDRSPRTGFTLGIDDDVSHTSLPPDPAFPTDPPGVVCAVFYGLGADGTVGANKNTVKIIAEDAGLHAQGYFVYDSHKSGAQTISHLRFGEAPIRAPVS